MPHSIPPGQPPHLDPSTDPYLYQDDTYRHYDPYCDPHYDQKYSGAEIINAVGQTMGLAASGLVNGATLLKSFTESLVWRADAYYHADPYRDCGCPSCNTYHHYNIVCEPPCVSGCRHCC